MKFKKKHNNNNDNIAITPHSIHIVFNLFFQKIQFLTISLDYHLEVFNQSYESKMVKLTWNNGNNCAQNDDNIHVRGHPHSRCQHVLTAMDMQSWKLPHVHVTAIIQNKA